ncbi:MAG: response regulator transcription factor [Burkholderiaceae bacterium]
MRVAVLEDDEIQQRTIRDALTSAGMDVKIYGTGRELTFALRRESFDVMILDWTVPDTTGIELLKSLPVTNQRAPVLFATIRDAEEDVVEALTAGADDFMAKPLRTAELVARLRALVRRNQPATEEERFLQYDRFMFDLRTQSLQSDGEPIEMTQKEFHLALLLFRNIGRPLSRGHIREDVWGHDTDVPSRTMDTHVSRVRTKLNLRPEAGYLLAPVYSYGYRLEHLAANGPSQE